MPKLDLQALPDWGTGITPVPEPRSFSASTEGLESEASYQQLLMQLAARERTPARERPEVGPAMGGCWSQSRPDEPEIRVFHDVDEDFEILRPRPQTHRAWGRATGLCTGGESTASELTVDSYSVGERAKRSAASMLAPDRRSNPGGAQRAHPPGRSRQYCATCDVTEFCDDRGRVRERSEIQVARHRDYHLDERVQAQPAGAAFCEGERFCRPRPAGVNKMVPGGRWL